MVRWHGIPTAATTNTTTTTTALLLSPPGPPPRSENQAAAQQQPVGTCPLLLVHFLPLLPLVVGRWSLLLVVPVVVVVDVVVSVATDGSVAVIALIVERERKERGVTERGEGERLFNFDNHEPRGHTRFYRE
jgi:hypothetical protein